MDRTRSFHSRKTPATNASCLHVAVTGMTTAYGVYCTPTHGQAHTHNSFPCSTVLVNWKVTPLQPLPLHQLLHNLMRPYSFVLLRSSIFLISMARCLTGR